MRRQNILTAQRARGILVAAIVVVGTAGISGCTTARNALGPAESPCFRAIPLARAAVSDKGRFAGVRYISAKDFEAAIKAAKRQFIRGSVHLPDALSDVRGPVCAIAYRGQYKASRVAAGWAPTGRPGKVALVVVRLQKLDVIVTVVLSRPPLRFSKVFPPLI